MSCAVVSSTGEKWAGTAESISGSYLGIEVGDCFDFPTTVSNAIELTCDVPHEGEMYVVEESIGIDSPVAPYPTSEEWNSIAAAICNGPFAEYTGISIDDAIELSLLYRYIYPLDFDWSKVSRRVVSCAVTAYDGTRLLESVRVS